MRTVLGRLLLIVMIALAPGLLLQLNGEFEVRQTRRQLMQDEVIRLVRLVAGQQQGVLEGAEQVLTVIGSAAFVMERQPDLCRRLVTNLVHASPRYLTAGLIGADGHLICQPLDFAPTIDLAARSYFQRATQSNELVVGTYTIGSTSGAPTIHFAKAFRHPDGTVAGVAVVALDLAWLAERLAALSLPPGTAVSVRDRNGLLLARYPAMPDRVGTPTSEGNAIHASGWPGEATMRRGLDDRMRMTAFAPVDVDSQGLLVSVALDAGDSFATIVKANDRDTFLIACAIVIALAATALLGARFIRQPIRQLLAVADRWRAGDLSARTGMAGTQDEFGRLAAGFDAMASALQVRDAALRDSEAEYRATFEQASVGMAQLALDGTILRANDALCMISGRTREELIGHNFRELTYPDDRATDEEQIADLLSAGAKGVTAEKRYLRQDGSIVWINRWGSLLRDGAGRPSRLITIVEDISARKAAQSALEDSERRLRLAREAAGFGVWDWDAASATAVWSDQLCRLYGLPPRSEPVDRQTWLAALHPEDRAWVEAAMDAAIADPARPFDATFRIVRPDGATRWMHGKATILRDAGGNAERMVGLTMDVTDAHDIEAELRRLTADLEARVQEEVKAREEAQRRASHAERMQALGQLAGGIAHDFNNVLQMVLSASTLIEEAPGDEALVLNLARLITEAAERGSATTSRLLSMGRQGALHAEALDVTATLSGLRDIFVRTLGTSIQVDLRVEEGLPRMMADKAQLETTLINLGTNARDAMPRGGRIVLGASQEITGADDASPVDGLAPGAYVRLKVQDTGSGMDSTTLASVGKPFFTTKRAGAGTGLGIAMARSFVERSGGRMTIESLQGIGTTVALWLPVAPADAPLAALPTPRGAAAQPASGENTPAPTRLLLVDDEAPVRHVLALHLARKGFDVAVASGATEALAMIEMGLPVDGLITDLSMPGMDGVSLIHTVHRRHPGLPAVLLTGYAEAGKGVSQAIDGRAGGAYSLLRKPVTGQQLADRMSDLLGGRTAAAGWTDTAGAAAPSNRAHGASANV